MKIHTWIKLIFFYYRAKFSYMRVKYLIIVLLIFSTAAFLGCKLVIGTGTDESLEIVVKGESFTLAWDPGGSKIPNDPNSVVHYTVHYRNHGSVYWHFLMEIESSGSPECLITDELIDFGRYDFAVKAVGELGGVSTLHSSLDSTANPFCGWYINWVGSK